MLIKGREKARIKTVKNPKVFTDYSQTLDDVYENLEDYNLIKKRRVLLMFDDMMADIESNKELRPIATDLIFRGRKLNISFFCIPILFQIA